MLPVALDGHRYLISPYGESDWVRKLRAAGTVELHGRGGREPFRTTEVPVGERGPIIACSRRLAGRTVDPCFTDLPTSLITRSSGSGDRAHRSWRDHRRSAR